MIRLIMNATRFPSAVRRLRTLCLLAAASALLAACGGGKGGDSSSDTVLPASAKPGNASEAGRFLTQATYGPTSADVSHVQSVGFSTWLDEQFATASTVSYKTYWDTRDAAKKAVSATASAGTTEVNHAFWTNAVAGPDQLRQRVAFALSQIFVVSMQDSCGADHPQGVAHYMDTLVSHAFGSYRSLLEAVSVFRLSDGQGGAPARAAARASVPAAAEAPPASRTPGEEMGRKAPAKLPASLDDEWAEF